MTTPKDPFATPAPEGERPPTAYEPPDQHSRQGGQDTYGQQGGQPSYGQAPPPPGYGQPPAYGQPPYGQPPYGQSGFGAGGPVGKPSNGLGVAALVLGILGVLTSLVLIGGVLGLVAVGLGIAARARVKRGLARNGGMALAGIVLGVIAVMLTTAVVVTAVVLGGDFFSCLWNAGNDTAAADQCQRDFSGTVAG